MMEHENHFTKTSKTSSSLATRQCLDGSGVVASYNHQVTWLAGPTRSLSASRWQFRGTGGVVCRDGWMTWNGTTGVAVTVMATIHPEFPSITVQVCSAFSVQDVNFDTRQFTER